VCVGVYVHATGSLYREQRRQPEHQLNMSSRTEPLDATAPFPLCLESVSPASIVTPFVLSFNTGQLSPSLTSGIYISQKKCGKPQIWLRLR